MKSEKNDSLRELDDLLKDALKPVDKPDEQLNRRLLAQAKEENYMRKCKIPAAILVAICILMFGSLSVAAAVHFLRPADVAQNQEDIRLATILEEENQLSKYENQAAGGYRVTFIGMVSGEKLTDFPSMDNGKIISSETYAVTAIEREDGTPISETSSEWDMVFREAFFVEGMNPYVTRFANSSSKFCKDGIVYCIFSSENIEVFADRTVYLAVYEESSWTEEQEYIYDEKTGKISQNKLYGGLNTLFTIPLDSSKADPEAAEKYVQDLQMSEEEKDFSADVTENSFSYKFVTPEELYTEKGEKQLRERGELVAEVPCQVGTMEDGQSYVEFAYETTDGHCREGKRAIETGWEDFSDGTWLFMGYSESDTAGYAEIICKKSENLTMNVFRFTDEY